MSSREGLLVMTGAGGGGIRHLDVGFDGDEPVVEAGPEGVDDFGLEVCLCLAEEEDGCAGGGPGTAHGVGARGPAFAKVDGVFVRAAGAGVVTAEGGEFPEIGEADVGAAEGEEV